MDAQHFGKRDVPPSALNELIATFRVKSSRAAKLGQLLSESVGQFGLGVTVTLPYDPKVDGAHERAFMNVSVHFARAHAASAQDFAGALILTEELVLGLNK